MTQSIDIRTTQPSDVADIFTLELAYAAEHPGAVVVPGELYLSPGFHGGEDVFLARRGDDLLAYAPVYFQPVSGPAELPHRAWVEIKARPGIAEAEAVKDLLLEKVTARAKELAGRPRERAVRVSFQYNPNETPAITFVTARGFHKAESLFGMRRELAEPIPDAPAPAGVTIRRWKMETEAEQRQYVEARNECFPEAPVPLADWQYFLRSNEWASGTMITAFDGTELAGCVLAYWSPQEEGEQSGYTENIFTRRAWRGRGIALAMICEALRYLKEHGKTVAKLEVLALNEGALGVYTGLGYRVLSESSFYVRDLEETK